MSDPRDHDPEPAHGDAPADPGATRRGALMLGALGVSAVVTIRPALAQTAGSVLNCEIPVPDPVRPAGWIDPDGRMVPPNTPGAFAPTRHVFTGEQVKAAMRPGGTLPGVDADKKRAYLKYIGRLQQGQSGFTCFASLQMPRG